MDKLSNREIVDIYLNNRLLKTCIECQFKKILDRRYEEDFFQDLVLYLLTYDNDKLNDAHFNNHFNALVTRIVQNNIFSVTSPYYKNYKKFEGKIEDITPYIRDNTPLDDE
jgi:hypothetical protein